MEDKLVLCSKQKKVEMYLQMMLIKTGQNRNCCCCCNKFENNCKISSSEFKENVINALYKVVAKIVKGLRCLKIVFGLNVNNARKFYNILISLILLLI
jgi:hypothetical protein